MTKDEQARALLVEIALLAEAGNHPTAGPITVRHLAGFKNPRAGSWCAAGLTAAMEDAGLVVPAPGTPARRGAVACEDFVDHIGERVYRVGEDHDYLHVLAQPGDIIAWLQHPPGKDPTGWRRGHVALIVAVDDESVTTVGWNEGAAPGRVMKRRLWRDPAKMCTACNGVRRVGGRGSGGGDVRVCNTCKGNGRVPRSSTVLYRRPGGLYGMARPVAR